MSDWMLISGLVLGCTGVLLASINGALSVTESLWVAVVLLFLGIVCLGFSIKYEFKPSARGLFGIGKGGDGS